MLSKGQLIDNRYKIIGEIGEGGMANVFLAWDTILERNVAVKLLRGDLADDEKFVKRFQREATAASSLRHPNIVEMYDVGEDNGNYFIVMEFVDGKTLKSLIKRRGALNLNEALDIMLQLTSAIACAHDSYIIHRDIKPQNVLIKEDGRVKITDFGIAMALNQAELTQTNSVMGSVHYLPPEQASGQGSTIKSDIYSLGILMFELLTGRIPYKGDNAVEIALKHMKDPIPSVRDIKENIPQSVENIILKASAKNPKNRYDSVAEMYEDIRTALDENRINEERLVYRFPETDLETTKVMDKIDATDSSDKESLLDDLEDKKLNKALVIGICIAVGIIVSGLLVFLLLLNGAGKEVNVPSNLTGLTKEEACSKIEKKGLVCKVEYGYDENVMEGKVISVDPKSNKKVKKGNKVTITICKDESIKIEDYTGENIELIENKLKKLGLVIIKTPQKVDKESDVKENTIISQSVKEGERLNEGDPIELVYATLITVYPNFTDGTYTTDEIQAFCEDNKITCQFKEEESDEAVGTILNQNREEGVEVISGTTLIITVAKEKLVADNIDNAVDNNMNSDSSEDTN